MSNKKPKYCKKAIAAVNERFVRVPSKGYPQFYDLNTCTSQGDTYFLQKYYELSIVKKGADIPEGDYLMGGLNVVWGEIFKPSEPQLSEGMLNLWKEPDLGDSGGNVEDSGIPLFMEFLKRWFPDFDQREYFIWWMAHCVCRPEEKIVATPVLRSEHGIGKGFFVETIMAELLGHSSVAACKLSAVTGDFNDVCEGKTLVLLDEVYTSKKRTVDALKSIQGNKTFELRRKHKPTITVDNYINFIVTSNDHIPLTLEKGDRRFWVPDFIRHKVSEKETSGFINKKLKPWLMREDGIQEVRDWLGCVDLDHAYPHSPAPMTDAKQELMGYSTAERLEDQLKESLLDVPVTTVGDIVNAYKELFPKLTEMAAANALKELGCEMKRCPAARYWITPYGKGKGLSSKSRPKELQSQYLKLSNF